MQELLALGLTNLIGPFFLSYTASASLSRSAVLDAVGGHTQLSGLFSFVIVAIILIFLAPLFAALPTAVLAAIILGARVYLFVGCHRKIPTSIEGFVARAKASTAS